MPPESASKSAVRCRMTSLSQNQCGPTCSGSTVTAPTVSAGCAPAGDAAISATRLATARRSRCGDGPGDRRRRSTTAPYSTHEATRNTPGRVEREPPSDARRGPRDDGDAPAVVHGALAAQVAQGLLVHLEHRRHRHLGEEGEAVGPLEAGQLGADEGAQLGQRRRVARVARRRRTPSPTSPKTRVRHTEHRGARHLRMAWRAGPRSPPGTRCSRRG